MNYKNDKECHEFVDAYIACALWSTNDESTPDGGEPLDANYNADSIDPQTRFAMTIDCQVFIETHKDHLVDYPATNAGHDFWLSRNGHGAGFFDHDFGTREQGDALQIAARKFEECNLYVGDDNVLYI